MSNTDSSTVGDVLAHLTPAQYAMLRMADFEYWETLKKLVSDNQFACERCHVLHWKTSAIGRKHDPS